VIRINLLPPEILEKRKAESRRLLLVAVLLVVLAILGLSWGFLVLQEQIKASEVASKQQEASNLQAQAAQFKVFEDRNNDLRKRTAIADKALAGRINWSRLMSEVALVLPADLWLDRFDGSQATGGSGTPGAVQQQSQGAGSKTGTTAGAVLNLGGWSLYTSTVGPDNGFKPIAKLLVRLNDLDQLKNVWLQSAEYKEKGFRQQNAIQWTVLSEVITPGQVSNTSTSTVPPPPAP
jgi:Tfp pilus assembly protein PilN